METKAKAKLSNAEIVENITKRLEESIDDLIESNDWKKYLSFVKGQHPYSWNNTFLIMFEGWIRGWEQPATYVRGAKQWEKVGRTIKKGEKAIWILAPRIQFVCNEKGCSGFNQRTLWNKFSRVNTCKIDARHRIEKKMLGFMSVPVFDIQQTEGDPITEFKPLKDEVQGATDKLWDDLTELADKYGFEVIIGDARGTDGYCTHEKKEIVIDEGAEFGYRLKTLIHEMAHMILHADINDYQLNRARYETEAEGVAYVVAEALGIHSETDAYSFGYIATWGKDDTKKLVKESLSRIQKCANEIIGAIETGFEI
jgi:hypothetical protein